MIQYLKKHDTLGASLLIFAGVVVWITLSMLSSCTTPGPTLPVKLEPVVTPTSTPQGCCPRVWPGTHDGPAHAAVKTTGYYPDSSALEGGFNDRHGVPLKTLQGFLSWKSNAVTIAMDTTIAAYGTRVCSPELNTAYGRALPLEIKDTGGAFKGKGWGRADICVANRAESLKNAVNGHVTLVECK